MNRLTTLILTALFVMLTIFLLCAAMARLADAAPAPQLGSMDNCETFYRLAKQSIHEFDGRIPQPQLETYKAAVRFDPALSAAYSQLYLACRARNNDVR